MTGEILYWHYAQAHSEQNCGVEAWGDMSHDDQQIWNRMAETISEVFL